MLFYPDKASSKLNRESNQEGKQNYMVQLELNQNAKKPLLSRIVNSAIQKYNSNYVLTFVIAKYSEVKCVWLLFKLFKDTKGAIQ